MILSSDSDVEFARRTYEARRSTEIECPILCILLLLQRMFEGERLYLHPVVDMSQSHSLIEEMGL